MIKITENASLLPYNTFGMDVQTALLVEYDTVDDLRTALANPQVTSLMEQQRKAGQLPFWHIGSGSNLLFKGNYLGVVLHCTCRGIHLVEPALSEDECLLEVEGGTLWDDVCSYCAQHELYGTENLSLIPGEMGAAAVQNIGAYGVEIKDLIHEVICLDTVTGNEYRLSVGEMNYGYRESLLKHAEAKARYIVLRVVLKLSRKKTLHLGYAGLLSALGLDSASGEGADRLTAQEVRDAVIRIRQGKLPDPVILGNAGSFFKNPVVDNSIFDQLLAQYPNMPHYTVDDAHTKIPAGWMIEQCGWKGRSLGRAGVYEKQSLVLVNLGGATPEEIVTLCQTVIADVKRRFGITIEPEVNLIDCNGQ